MTDLCACMPGRDDYNNAHNCCYSCALLRVFLEVGVRWIIDNITFGRLYYLWLDIVRLAYVVVLYYNVPIFQASAMAASLRESNQKLDRYTNIPFVLIVY